MDKECCLKEILLLKKLCELKLIVKIYEIESKVTLKRELVEVVYQYILGNINYIMRKIVIYEELELLNKICKNGFNLSINGKINDRSLKSLEALSLVYINKENNTVSIPSELQEKIKKQLSNIGVIESAKKRQNIIEFADVILGIYGIMPFSLAEKYIVQFIDDCYIGHEILKIIRQYNSRYEFFSQDLDNNFYSKSIIDKDYIQQKTQSININYRHYDEVELENYYRCYLTLNKAEREIYIKLNRFYKDKNKSLSELKKIIAMIQNGYSSLEISKEVSKEIKIKSEVSKKKLQELIEILKDKYPLWILKGHLFNEIKDINTINNIERSS